MDEDITSSLREEARADAFLVYRALSGEADSVSALVARLIPVVSARVRRGLARRGLAPELAPDLTQEVWLSLLASQGRALRQYDPSRGASLEGYVGMISEREIGNRLQMQRAKKRAGKVVSMEGIEIVDPSARNDPESEVATAELAARLGRHLESVLPARGLLVFRFAFTDGLAPERIAAILGVELQVIYNWQHRIRDVARRFLDSEDAKPTTGPDAV
jgi:RNA polymerase sigma factor (sigma-70 family)